MPGLGQQPEAQPEDPGVWRLALTCSPCQGRASGSTFLRNLVEGAGQGWPHWVPRAGWGLGYLCSLPPNTRAHTEMHAHTATCPPMHTCTHAHMNIYTYTWNARTCMHECIRTHVNMHVATHGHTCTRPAFPANPNSLDSLFLRRTQVCWLDSLHRCRGRSCQVPACSCRPAEIRVTSGRLGKASCCSCFWCGSEGDRVATGGVGG